MNKAGYTYFREHYRLPVPPLGMELGLHDASQVKIKSFGRAKIKLLPQKQYNLQSDGDHLELAIKFQGIRLSYLAPLFDRIDKESLAAYIKVRPTSEIRRCIWFLYEWLTESELDLPDSKANYTPLLDDQYYYTLREGRRHPRTRVIDNLPGNRNFCPLVRKTPDLQKKASRNVMQEANTRLQKIVQDLNPELLGRSINYLYTQETQTSSAIENEKDQSLSKNQRFLQVLKHSGTLPLSQERLLYIQNQLVRSDLKDQVYRQEEVYVGSTRPTSTEIFNEIDFVGPRYIHVASLMEGWLQAHETLLLDNTIPPLIHAAMLSFGFVYIHPFRDGNGRTHRYIIHDILKARSPAEFDFIIPVSAAILKNRSAYYKMLANLSDPIMSLLEYQIDDNGIVTIENDLTYLYRYPDLTDHTSFLYDMMELSIEEDLVNEIKFIVQFDRLKAVLDTRFDLPNRELDLLCQFLLQNNGKIANRKRKQALEFLSVKDIPEIEAIYRETVEN